MKQFELDISKLHTYDFPWSRFSIDFKAVSEYGVKYTHSAEVTDADPRNAVIKALNTLEERGVVIEELLSVTFLSTVNDFKSRMRQFEGD